MRNTASEQRGLLSLQLAIAATTVSHNLKSCKAFSIDHSIHRVANGIAKRELKRSYRAL